jgi:hypothetical protein
MPIITLIEYFNSKKLQQLKKSPFIPVDQKKMLIKFAKKKSQENLYVMDYEYSDKSVNETGRLYRNAGQFQKEIRWYGAEGKYIDLDFENCQSNIFRQLFNMQNMSSPNLDYYCKNRTTVLAQKHLKKRFINCILYNKNAEPFDPFFKDIHHDMYIKLLEPLKNEFSELWKSVSGRIDKDKKGNKEGSFLALVGQTYENKCLLAMYDFFKDKGREIGTLVYDGLHLRKLTDDEVIPEELLRECETFIFEKTGFNMHIVSKPMKNSPNSFGTWI